MHLSFVSAACPRCIPNGHESKIARSGRAHDHAGSSRVLRNLSTCTVHYFALVQQRHRRRQPVSADHQRQGVSPGLGGELEQFFSRDHVHQPSPIGRDRHSHRHRTAGKVLVFVFNAPEGGTTFVSGGIGLISTTACSGKSSNAVSFTINP